MKGTIHVVSVSGGQDSAATAALALASVPRDRLRFIFCDTGNEHAAVYEYLGYLEQFFRIKIDRLMADFSGRIAAKRSFIANDRRRDRSKRWTNAAKRRALSVLHPTGNPFLDLCLWKGRFPSRCAQFCTEELKRNPAIAYQLAIIDAGHTVLSWQGIRRDESERRSAAKKIERLAPGMWAFRPLVHWTKGDVFDYCAAIGLRPNPLYLQGMGRVGCMPCINAAKGELRHIVSRFPQHIDRIRSWESKVSLGAKRGFSTFFNKELHTGHGNSREIFANNNVDAVAAWARTSRGGRQVDLFASDDTHGCASSYGLCEAGWES